VYLRDIWPSAGEIAETIQYAVQADMFHKRYAEVYDGDEHWHALETPSGDRFAWAEDSTTSAARRSSKRSRPSPNRRRTSRARASWPCSATRSPPTTSPRRSIKADSPAGRYLQEHGVEPADFNSYAHGAATTRS